MSAWIWIIAAIGLGIAICVCLAIANFAPEKFLDVYREISQEEIYQEISTLQFVRQINDQEFGGRLVVQQVDKLAGDAYVRGGVLLLSTNTLQSRGLASFATLAHELGHAQQDRDSNKLKVKQILTIIGKIVGPFLFPSLIAGLILAAIGKNLLWWGVALLGVGLAIFLFSLILKLFIISIEKDASKKAMKILEDGLNLNKKQLKLAKKLLNSAKLTYWGSFFASLLGWTFLIRKRYKN